MAVFPRYDEDVGFDVPRAPDIDINAGAIGRNVTILGSAFGDLGAMAGNWQAQSQPQTAQDIAWQALQKQQSDFDTDARLRSHIGQSHDALEQARAAMPPGAGGFASAALTGQNKRDEALLAALPPQARPRAAAQLLAWRPLYNLQAADAEHQGRSDYEGGTLEDTFQGFAKGLASDPSQFAAMQASLHASIDNASTLSPGQKQAARQRYDTGLAVAALQALYRNDPDGAARALYPKGDGGSRWPLDYFALVRQHESGGSDKADSGIAVGRYQFTAGTWSNLAKAHADLGLTSDGRTDPAQQERAMRALTADNQKVLQDHGIEASNANTYMAHFLGAGGATTFLKAMQADPNQSAAALLPTAAKNNRGVFYDHSTGGARSLAQVYAAQTGMFGANADAPVAISDGGADASAGTTVSPGTASQDSISQAGGSPGFGASSAGSTGDTGSGSPATAFHHLIPDADKPALIAGIQANAAQARAKARGNLEPQVQAATKGLTTTGRYDGPAPTQQDFEAAYAPGKASQE